MAPGLLPLVCVLQAMENLAIGIPPTRYGPGWPGGTAGPDCGRHRFHYSALSEFRDRLAVGGRAARLLELMLDAASWHRGSIPSGDSGTADASTPLSGAVRRVRRPAPASAGAGGGTVRRRPGSQTIGPREPKIDFGLSVDRSGKPGGAADDATHHGIGR